MMRLPNRLDCNTEVLFAKAFFTYPWFYQGVVKPKGNKKNAQQVISC